MTDPKDDASSSPPPEGEQRFLVHVIEHGLHHGRRTHADLLRHFPPATMMEALESEPDLRAEIVTVATGMRTRIAARKDPAENARDLEIALAEDEADAETIVEAFAPDDRVRFLPRSALWDYIAEGEFWNGDGDGDAFAISREHVRFVMQNALEEGVIEPRDVVEGIGVDELALHLPPSEISKVLAAALDSGRDGAAFADEGVLAQVPCDTLAAHVPLPVLWRGVVDGRIVPALGLGRRTAKPAMVPSSAAKPPSEPAARVPVSPPPPKAPLGRIALVKQPTPVSLARPEKRASRYPLRPRPQSRTSRRPPPPKTL